MQLFRFMVRQPLTLMMYFHHCIYLPNHTKIYYQYHAKVHYGKTIARQRCRCILCRTGRAF
jgi:hypothetical protein